MNVKKELWLLLGSFILPITVGTAFFYYNPTYFTENTVNYGKLITPIITTKQTDINFNDQHSIKGIWSLAYRTDNCNLDCMQAIKNMKTINLLLNDNMRRLQRIVFTSQTITTDDKGLLFATISSSLTKKLTTFPQQTIFLIDPIGNIMLFYDANNLNIKKIIKDLNRLFKYSRIG